MGRYFQHVNWPSADFEADGNQTAIPQSAVRFHSSGGVHLIHARFTYVNGSGAAVSLQLQIFLDGAAILGVPVERAVPFGFTDTFQTTALLEIPAGPHILEVAVRGAIAAGDTVTATTGYLLAIELNPQEARDRIEGP